MAQASTAVVTIKVAGGTMSPAQSQPDIDHGAKVVSSGAPVLLKERLRFAAVCGAFGLALVMMLAWIGALGWIGLRLVGLV